MTRLDKLIDSISALVDDERLMFSEQGQSFSLAEPLLIEALAVRNELRKDGFLPNEKAEHSALSEELAALSQSGILSEKLNAVLSQAAKALR